MVFMGLIIIWLTISNNRETAEPTAENILCKLICCARQSREHLHESAAIELLLRPPSERSLSISARIIPMELSHLLARNRFDGSLAFRRSEIDMRAVRWCARSFAVHKANRSLNPPWPLCRRRVWDVNRAEKIDSSFVSHHKSGRRRKKNSYSVFATLVSSTAEAFNQWSSRSREEWSRTIFLLRSISSRRFLEKNIKERKKEKSTFYHLQRHLRKEKQGRSFSRRQIHEIYKKCLRKKERKLWIISSRSRQVESGSDSW